MEADTQQRISLAGEPGSPTEGQQSRGGSEAAPTSISGLVPIPSPSNASPVIPQQVQGKQVRRKEGWVKIDDDAYPDFNFKMWINYPQKYDDAIKTTATPDEIRETLGKIVLAHDGWLDEEGMPYPPANTPEFWKSIPNELAAAIITLVRLEATNLPNLLMEKRQNMKRT